MGFLSGDSNQVAEEAPLPGLSVSEGFIMEHVRVPFC